MKGFLASILIATLMLSLPGAGNAQAQSQSKTRSQPKTLAEAVASYQLNYDYASLELISKHLKVGMTLAQVVAWLGEGDMPICGQYRWSSDREEYSREAERNIVVGLVMDFECDDGEHPGGLKSWEMMQIAE